MTLRFVILTHDHPDWHWDFMLEQGKSLRTWRLLEEPLSASPIDATPLSDHRLDYLEYEGPVSGGRGEVRRWDSGVYRIVSETDGNLVVELAGKKLHGTARIEHGPMGNRFVFCRERSAM